MDSDGEILLIEAADWIPRWAAEPAAAEGRVFFYRGQVRIVFKRNVPSLNISVSDPYS